MNRPCLDCGEPTNRSRCDDCAVEHARAKNRARGSATQRGYDAKWQRISERARRMSPFCAKCGATDDLTADHIVPRSAGGLNVLANVQVLCRRCNSRKANKYEPPTQLGLLDDTGVAPRSAAAGRPALQAKSELLISVTGR